MSAPARAWLTAARASSSSVASLSTEPSSRTTPQCPCVVYSHRHTSVSTSSSRQLTLDRAGGELDRALLVPRAGPLLVLLGRDAEQHHGRDAQLRGAAGLRDGLADVRRATPGIAEIGPRADSSSDHEQRQDQGAGA